MRPATRWEAATFDERSGLEPTAERGFVLMMTLWVLATLAVLLLTFALHVRASVSASSYLRKHQEASHLARGAVRRLAIELAPSETADASGDLELIRGGRLGLWLVDPADWSVRQLDPDEAGKPPEMDRWVLCEVVAEDAKFPLNRADAGSLSRLGLSPVVAQAVESRRQADGEGAGFRLLGELLAVPGIDHYYDDGRDEEPAIEELLTTFSDGRVFINRARLEVISAIPGVDAQTAFSIRQRIEDGEFFERVDLLQNVMGVTPEIMASLRQWVKVTPRFYRVEAVAHTGGVARGAVGVFVLEEEAIRVLTLRSVGPGRGVRRHALGGR